MPRSKEQINALREQRKSHIKNVALDLFSREGYGHVSIAMLAGEAGISKGLMYNYFSSKEELLKEIIGSGVDEIMVFFDPDHDGVLTKEEFRLFIRKTFQMMYDKREFFTKFFGLMIQPNVKTLIMETQLVQFMMEFMHIFENYFKSLGYEDPALELFHFSVLIEGFGAMLLFYDDLADFPPELFEKFEERIITTYT